MTLRPPKWDLRGLVVLVMAAALGMSLVASILGVAWQGRPLSDQGSEILAAVCGGIIGVIASYVAGRFNGDKEP